MSLVLFEGSAGTGKTYQLLAAAKDHLRNTPLESDHRLLALTKFHGSRRRMEAKLKHPDGVGRAVDCVTIDSFALGLVRRWRSLARMINISTRQGDFRSITSAAGQLLKDPNVGAWVGRRYPLILVDELQDCKGGEIEILAGLSQHAQFLCAADEFQDLSGEKDNEAVSWANAAGRLVELTQVHRTSVGAFLKAARALRNGLPLVSDRKTGFEFVGVPTAPLGGAKACWHIKIRHRSGQMAAISPAKPGTSPFVDRLLEWVSTRSAKSHNTKKTAGPFRIEWETGEESACEKLLQELEIPRDAEAQVSCKDLANIALEQGAADVRDWANRLRNVAGQDLIGVGQAIDQIRQIVHRRRAFGPSRHRKRIAMTVHQAKNREFESVLVLWPLRMVTDVEKQKRFLYNAVTRARRNVMIIVEDPGGDRLGRSPFKA